VVIDDANSRMVGKPEVIQRRGGAKPIWTLARNVVTLVIATCMESDQTTIYVVDPPNDESDPDRAGPFDLERVSEKIGERKWRITDLEKFSNRLQQAKDSQLLKWAGQFGRASEIDREILPVEHQLVLPDIDLQSGKIKSATFLGYTSLFFPEMGSSKLMVFKGVEADLLHRTLEGSLKRKDLARTIQNQLAEYKLHPDSPYESISTGGTCNRPQRCHSDLVNVNSAKRAFGRPPSYWPFCRSALGSPHDPLRGGFLPAEVWAGAILSETTKVLLAEDDPHFIRYLVVLLDQMNCEIAVEHNGEDAIRRAATFQPDVAFVGFVMPGIAGSANGIGLQKVSPHTRTSSVIFSNPISG
jgi:hypothetical protein